MGRILVIEPIGGIAGDMAVAALLDAGAPLEVVRAGLSTLGLGGFELQVSRGQKNGIHGTKVRVAIAGHGPHRDFADIRALYEASTLAPGPKAIALAIFERLAVAEGLIHDTTPDHVHFHEVGAVDSIVDITAFALALDALSCERVFATAPPLGGGIVQSEHGPIPVPAPATLELLRGRPVRTSGEGERVTPTGAAILAACTEPGPPAHVPVRVGYGVGHRDFADTPNLVRATVAETETLATALVEISCNLDDATGQVLARALVAALEAGAVDAWIAPVIMKKGRPGHVLTALAPDGLRAAVTLSMLRETPTLGVRFHPVDREILERRFETVETPWGPVRIKVAHRGGEVFGGAPEWEDCAEIAAKHAIPAREVQTAALLAWARLSARLPE